MPPNSKPQAKPQIKNTPEVKEAVEMSKQVATAMEEFQKKHNPDGKGTVNVDVHGAFGGGLAVLRQENKWGITVIKNGEAYKFSREGDFFDLSHVKDYNSASPDRAGEDVFRYNPGSGEVKGDAEKYTTSAKALLALIAEANRPQER
jgi:hypothetical protein